MRRSFCTHGSIRPWMPRWLWPMDLWRNSTSPIGILPITRPTRSSRSSRRTTQTTLLSAATLIPRTAPHPSAWFSHATVRSLPAIWMHSRATARPNTRTSSTAAWVLSHRMAREWRYQLDIPYNIYISIFPHFSSILIVALETEPAPLQYLPPSMPYSPWSFTCLPNSWVERKDHLTGNPIIAKMLFHSCVLIDNVGNSIKRE